MKKGFFLLLVACAISGAAFALARDTAQPLARAPQLKNKTLTAETLIATGHMAASKKLTPAQLSVLSLKSLDKTFDPQLQYHLIDTLYRADGYYILLLGQWYDFENKAWVASYAAPGKLIDHRQVFYDNAEGFLSVETEIKANTLTITTYNEYAEGAAKKKVEKFRFAPNYKLQRL